MQLLAFGAEFQQLQRGVNLVDCGKFKLTAISYQSVADGNNFKEKILTYKIFGLVMNMYIVAE